MRYLSISLVTLFGCHPSPAPTPHLVMGNAHRTIHTTSPVAQREFDIGLDALYAFNFDEAIYHFETAMRADPACAMCAWGYSYARGPNINAPDKQWPGAHDSAERAAKLATDPVEKAIATALVTRYVPATDEFGPVEPATRDKHNAGFADAVAALAKQYSDDVGIQVMYGDALLCALPRQIPSWDRAGKPVGPRIVEAKRVLEAVLARHPDHVGAIHFYIHTLDNSPQAALAAPYADRIGKLAPAAGHLVHMASHIYLQTGRYAEAEDANLAAMASDHHFLASVPPGSEYESFTNHPAHFLWYTLLLEGKQADALHYAEHTAHHLTGPLPFRAGFAASMKAITLVRFARWDDALAMPDEPALPISHATGHFAKGLALVAKGRFDEAATHVAEIRKAPEHVMQRPPGAPPPPPEVDGREKAQLAGNVESAALQLEGAIALARGDRDTAIALFEKAAAAEDGIPQEGETKMLPLPARQRLGVAYLAAGRAADAERVYREDLARQPETGWSLFGLATALDALHHPDAKAVWGRFHEAWARSDVKLTGSVL